MFLGIIAKFFGRKKRTHLKWVDELRNQTPTAVTRMNTGVHVIQGKGRKYLAFLTALHFMKTMIWIRNMTSWCKNSLYNRELNYKQLWCAPLQRDAAWEITLRLTSQLWNTMQQWKKYKANNVIAHWSLQGAITQLWFDRFSVRSNLWLNKKWRRGGGCR